MNDIWLSNLTLIRSLYAGKLLVDRGSQNLFSGVDNLNIPMKRKLEVFEFIFLAVAKRGSAEEEKGKEVWGEIKTNLREGKGIAMGL